ncbi:MAG: TIGR00730 family Rossman fold protein [Anaerolineaceae bacterium]|nr:TIGR00730 family Rossman fold protein [Anaerolineaceae bacterium]
MTTFTVYCGSADNLADEYIKAAKDLGSLLAVNHHTLVFGGGKTGLMGAVADGALASGGIVIGVINEGLNTPALAHSGLTCMEVLPDLQMRKARMAAMADAFIALPGGFGTFDELFETLTNAQIGLHHKPIGLLNVRHYFDPLLTMVDHAIAEAFIYPEHRGMLCCSKDAPTLLKMLKDYRAPENLARWVDRDDL